MCWIIVVDCQVVRLHISIPQPGHSAASLGPLSVTAADFICSAGTNRVTFVIAEIGKLRDRDLAPD